MRNRASFSILVMALAGSMLSLSPDALEAPASSSRAKRKRDPLTLSQSPSRLKRARQSRSTRTPRADVPFAPAPPPPSARGGRNSAPSAGASRFVTAPAPATARGRRNSAPPAFASSPRVPVAPPPPPVGQFAQVQGKGQAGGGAITPDVLKRAGSRLKPIAPPPPPVGQFAQVQGRGQAGGGAITADVLQRGKDRLKSIGTTPVKLAKVKAKEATKDQIEQRLANLENLIQQYIASPGKGALKGKKGRNLQNQILKAIRWIKASRAREFFLVELRQLNNAMRGAGLDAFKTRKGGSYLFDLPRIPEGRTVEAQAVLDKIDAITARGGGRQRPSAQELKELRNLLRSAQAKGIDRGTEKEADAAWDAFRTRHADLPTLAGLATYRPPVAAKPGARPVPAQRGGPAAGPRPFTAQDLQDLRSGKDRLRSVPRNNGGPAAGPAGRTAEAQAVLDKIDAITARGGGRQRPSAQELKELRNLLRSAQAKGIDRGTEKEADAAWDAFRTRHADLPTLAGLVPPRPQIRGPKPGARPEAAPRGGPAAGAAAVGLRNPALLGELKRTLASRRRGIDPEEGGNAADDPSPGRQRPAAAPRQGGGSLIGNALFNRVPGRDAGAKKKSNT